VATTKPTIAVLLVAGSVALGAQDTTPRVEFEAVSIKPHDVSAGAAISMRLVQDGTAMLTNVTMMTVLGRSTTVPARDIVGVPEWVNSERYDINAKAAAGGRRDQDRQRAMWRAMLEDRMKLVTHTEQRERDIYVLVLARKDGKLGPELKPSTLDCSSPQTPTAFTPAQRGQEPSIEMYLQRCGIGLVGLNVVSGGATIDQLARMLEVGANAAVENRTGLQGLYSFTVSSALARVRPPSVDSNAAAPDDTPDVFVAVQEQLGLKLQHEKRMLPVLVVDHIERPSAD
jgi:uncharacterized protein (TIGR03435 family)